MTKVMKITNRNMGVKNTIMINSMIELEILAANQKSQKTCCG